MTPDRPRFTSMHDAFCQAVEEAPTLPRDLALIALANRLAERIDAVDDEITEGAVAEGRGVVSMEGVRDKLIKNYLGTLDRLGMTPAARTSQRGVEGGPVGAPDPSAVALAHLQRGAQPGAAAVGVDYAAAVDPAVTDALAGD